MKLRTWLLAIVIVSLPIIASAKTGVLTVRATGQVAVVPDIATVSVGVEVDGPTADRALRENSARMSDIIALLKERGIAPRDIQTSQFSLHPQWTSASSSSSKPPKITGFVAANAVSVRVRNLDLLGPVLDALTKSGANRIQGVSFDVSEPTPHLDRARELAVIEAMRKARLLADSAGTPLGAILSIEEGGGGSDRGFAMEARAMMDTVPIAEGEISLNATVTLRFAIGAPD